MLPILFYVVDWLCRHRYNLHDFSGCLLLESFIQIIDVNEKQAYFIL